MVVTKRALFSWVIRSHWPLQLLLLLLIITSIFFRLLPLELQKRVVNIAIQLKRVDLLLIYCGLYIVSVILFSAFKYAINMLQGYIGLKVLKEMQTGFYEHILKLPLQFFRQTQPGTVITSLGSELSAIGSFLGGALAVPVTSGLTLLTFAGYMLYLDVRLALISLAIYPAELIVLPILQKRYNRLNSIRVDEKRAMSNAVSEAISGIHEIQGNASFHLELERFGAYVNRLFYLVNRMHLLHYGAKFANNFFQNLGPFALFLVGGYLTIQGEFTLGALVAFLSAYEKIYDPWKELISYYQTYQDARVRYNRIVETFDTESDFPLFPVDRPVYSMKGELKVQDLEYKLENGVHLLDEVSFHLKPGEQMALVGFSGSGKSTLAMVLGQLYQYDRGHVFLDGHELRQLTKMDVGANIGFIAQHPFIFNGTVRENVFYGCQALLSAEGRGSSRVLPGTDEVLDMLRIVGMDRDVIRFGLEMVVPREMCEALAPDLIRMRQMITGKFGDKLSEMVELYDVNKFLHHVSIYENLLFADAYASAYLPKNIAANPTFLRFLEDMNLDERLLRLGKELAQQTVILFKDLGEDNAFFFEATPMEPAYFEAYSRIVTRPRVPGRKDKALLLKLALDFVPARHKIVAIPPSLQEMIVEARQRFIQEIIGADLAVCRLPAAADDPPSAMPHENMDFSPYCPTEYQYSHTLFDNLVYGRIRAEQISGRNLLVEQIIELLEKEHRLEDVMNVGLDFAVGSMGDRLSGGQRQKIALARALLKKPPILIMDEATASMDNASQARIQRYIEEKLKGKSTVVTVIHRLDIVKSYDMILVLRAGRVVESGNYRELMERKGVFYDLVQGK